MTYFLYKSSKTIYYGRTSKSTTGHREHPPIRKIRRKTCFPTLWRTKKPSPPTSTPVSPISCPQISGCYSETPYVHAFDSVCMTAGACVLRIRNHGSVPLQIGAILADIPDGHPPRFRDTFSVELLLAGVPIERVSILLGHQGARITEKHYAPWVRARQERLEADVRRIDVQ